MLKITRKVEYALIALGYLQKKGKNQLASAKEIAKQYSIPHGLLSKILQKLAREKIIHAVKGPSGGYRMSPDSSTMNMTRFFEILEGPVGLVDCYFDSDCNQINNCNIRTPINRINGSIKSMLDKMTLADISN